MVQQTPIPEYLYKIVSLEQWQESVRRHQFVCSSMDRDFIHLAKEDQLAHVVKKFWDKREYVVLKLYTQKLAGRLLLENNPGGTNKYYHLYNGAIPLDAVVEAVVMGQGHPE